MADEMFIPKNKICYVVNRSFASAFTTKWLEHLANVPAEKCIASNCILYSMKNHIVVHSNSHKEPYSCPFKFK